MLRPKTEAPPCPQNFIPELIFSLTLFSNGMSTDIVFNMGRDRLHYESCCDLHMALAHYLGKESPFCDDNPEESEHALDMPTFIFFLIESLYKKQHVVQTYDIVICVPQMRLLWECLDDVLVRGIIAKCVGCGSWKEAKEVDRGACIDCLTEIRIAASCVKVHCNT